MKLAGKILKIGIKAYIKKLSKDLFLLDIKDTTIFLDFEKNEVVVKGTIVIDWEKASKKYNPEKLKQIKIDIDNGMGFKGPIPQKMENNINRMLDLILPEDGIKTLFLKLVIEDGISYEIFYLDDKNNKCRKSGEIDI